MRRHFLMPRSLWKGRMEPLQFYLGALVGSTRSPVIWVVSILIGLLVRRLSLLLVLAVVAGLLLQIVADVMLSDAGLPLPPIGASAMTGLGQATAVLIIALAIDGCRRIVTARRAADGPTKSAPSTELGGAEFGDRLTGHFASWIDRRRATGTGREYPNVLGVCTGAASRYADLVLPSPNGSVVPLAVA